MFAWKQAQQNAFLLNTTSLWNARALKLTLLGITGILTLDMELWPIKKP